ncbi:MAG TPA: pyridoxamine 5'-phosphate oxidase family protein [Burkholderiales bacterium]|nr:pyridoxamine 5'-phosphate oxidase family protein [Burkholderiales bacterium]
MNAGDLRARIRRMLEDHATATLATADADGPWAAAVFYASDADLSLYFVTDPGTRHGSNLRNDARVACAIHADVANWSDVRGLQLEGTARIVAESERAAGLGVYLRKFPEVRRLSEAPRNDAEREIGERLGRVPLWRLAPARIRIIDNRERFGWKQELVL